VEPERQSYPSVQNLSPLYIHNYTLIDEETYAIFVIRVATPPKQRKVKISRTATLKPRQYSRNREYQVVLRVFIGKEDRSRAGIVL